ncbi:MAG TPA: class I SAM-dependent methyltransferase, partial [Solirubrobacteraceae bacterium]|nr:class I SAM-dependent methyltransferase [Solirubrobacteraceae bacterium]
MAAPGTTEEILDVNRRYHDVAAAGYDQKWGVDFGEVGRAQVLGKVRKLLGPRPGPFARSLEIGAGTGYFSLNLLQAGVVRAAVCTDVSPGMLTTLERNAERIGATVETAACDAAALPFADGSFDLVLGHAVLHHLPELDRAFAEFRRVLRPGGVLLFAGEPSRHGDRLAAVPKRAGLLLAPLWRRVMRA